MNGGLKLDSAGLSRERPRVNRIHTLAFWFGLWSALVPAKSIRGVARSGFAFGGDELLGLVMALVWLRKGSMEDSLVAPHGMHLYE